MAKRSVFYSRPFKIVVVGECGSGKSTLIQKFISGFCEESSEQDLKACKPTFVCDGHTALLKSTVKRVCKDGTSVALTNDDIGRRLWMKKFLKSASVPRSVVLRPEDQQHVVWDEIFVYLHKPRFRKDSMRRLKSETSTPTTSATTISGTCISSVRERAESSQTLPGRRNFLRTHASESLRVSGDTKQDVIEIEVDMWDTVGDKSLMWYRWYACTGADAVILCVPLTSILSYENARRNTGAKDTPSEDAKIAEVLQKFLSDEFLCSRTKKVDYRVPPVLLVGTKSEQCETGSVFDSEEEDIVDTIGLNLAAQIGCCDFVSCSGLRGYGVTSVFEAALAISLTSEGKYRASSANSNGESKQSGAESSLAREVDQPTYFMVHSFEKCPRPEVKVVQNGTDNLQESRSPPKIFFPPPPEFSPPSTLPPSSSSSSDRSSSPASSDLEADISAIECNKVHVRPKPMSFVGPVINVSSGESDEDQLPLGESKEEKIVTPTPTPRKYAPCNHSTPKSVRKAEVASTMYTHTKTLRDTVGSMTPPVPKPRHLLTSPKTHRRMTREKRRETVFVKFLQTIAVPLSQTAEPLVTGGIGAKIQSS